MNLKSQYSSLTFRLSKFINKYCCDDSFTAISKSAVHKPIINFDRFLTFTVTCIIIGRVCIRKLNEPFEGSKPRSCASLLDCERLTSALFRIPENLSRPY